MKSVSSMRSVLAGIVCSLASAGAASAAAVILDEGTFNSSLQSGSYSESFEGLSVGLHPNNLSFSGNGFGYSLDAFDQGGSTFYVTDGGGADGKFISATVASSEIVIVFTAGNVTAVGGEFFAAQAPIPLTLAPASFTLTLSDGTERRITTTVGNERAFVGFTSDVPIDSLTISAPEATIDDPIRVISLDNLTVGTAVVPEPWQGALVMGAGALAFAMFRRRGATHG